MESELRRRLSNLSTSTSTAKMLTWLPNPSLVSLSKDGQGPATSESLAVPGSLRDAHYAASAWFLGPKAENADYLKMFVETILTDLTQCRRNFAPEDEVSMSSLPHDHSKLIKIGYTGLRRCQNNLFTRIHDEYVKA